jgi:integrase
LAEVLQKLSVKRFTATSCNGLRTPGEGMRIGEAASLDAADFDPRAGVLTVRDAKFGRTRLLPLHPTAVTAVLEYRNTIAEAFPVLATEALLVSGAGTRLLTWNIGATFRQLVAAAGLEPRSASCRPRPHDLRHYADGWVMCPAVAFPLLGAAELVL